MDWHQCGFRKILLVQTKIKRSTSFSMPGAGSYFPHLTSLGVHFWLWWWINLQAGTAFSFSNWICSPNGVRACITSRHTFNN